MSKLDPSGRGLKKGESNIPGADSDDGGAAAIPVRYLGMGERAIIRPGVVMVAPAHETSHFLMKSAVFVYAMGLDAYGEHVTRGVIIDHPTAFTMGEMGGGSVVGTLGNNILFRGGDAGNDSALLLHSNANIVEEKDGSGSEPIGNSGLYEGGLSAAMEAADEGELDPESCKFFSTTCSSPTTRSRTFCRWKIRPATRGAVAKFRRTLSSTAITGGARRGVI